MEKETTLNDNLSKRNRALQQHPENPKFHQLGQMGSDQILRADSNEFILSSKGLDATDEGIGEQFTSNVNR